MACACKGVRPSLGACSGGNGGRPSSRPSPSSLSSLTTAGRAWKWRWRWRPLATIPYNRLGCGTCRRRLHPYRPSSPDLADTAAYLTIPLPATVTQPKHPTCTRGPYPFHRSPTQPMRTACVCLCDLLPTATITVTARYWRGGWLCGCRRRHCRRCSRRGRRRSDRHSGGDGSGGGSGSGCGMREWCARLPSSAGPCNTRGECCGSGTASHRIPAGYECSRRQWRRATCEQPSGWC